MYHSVVVGLAPKQSSCCCCYYFYCCGLEVQDSGLWSAGEEDVHGGHLAARVTVVLVVVLIEFHLADLVRLREHCRPLVLRKRYG